MNEPLKVFAVKNIPADVVIAWKARAKQDGFSMRTTIILALKKYLGM